MKKKLQSLIPWFITALILFVLFRKIPPGEVWEAVTAANISLFLFYAVLYFFLVMLADCWVLEKTLNRFVTKIKLKETLFMRGATYLLMLLNYNLAQASIPLYLKKTHQSPAFKSLGAILYLTVIDLTWIVTLSVLSAFQKDIFYEGINLSETIIRFSSFFYSGLILFFLFWKSSDSKMIKKLRNKVSLLDRFLNNHSFYAFRENRLGDFLKLFFLRLPMLVIIIISLQASLHAFHAFVPWPELFLYTPMIMLVGTLPITPAGAGTTPLLSLHFFKDHLQTSLSLSPDQILLSSSLLWIFTNLLFKAAFGLYCMKKKSRDLFT